MDFSFNVEFAKRYGVDEAIMLKSFQFWIRLNKANKINYHDKRYWTYNSNKSLTEYFPFWTEKQVRRIIDSLTDKQILIKGNYNKIAYDKTSWYAFMNQDLYLSDNFHLEDIPTDNKDITFCPNGQNVKPKKSDRFSAKGEPIPVANHVLNKYTNQVDSENEFSLPDLEIKNPFSRQSYHDALNTDPDPKENFASKEKVQREPSQTYLCFSAFCSTYERLAGVTYPSDNGNYIMTAKDGSNCKKLVAWLKKVSASEQAPEDMVTMFTTAAWQISDKWLKANFTISNIYSQANNIYTKFLYTNPVAKERKRQEEIDKLVNEFTL